MTISEFEIGKTRIMAEARTELGRIGIESHCVMFDVHGSQPLPEGASLTLIADGNSISGWFSAGEIVESRDLVARAGVREKIATLVAGLKKAAA